MVAVQLNFPAKEEKGHLAFLMVCPSSRFAQWTSELAWVSYFDGSNLPSLSLISFALLSILILD